MTDISTPVLISYLATQSGHTIAVLTLNDPKALNALSIDMCQIISQQLTQWQTNEQIVAVLLRGSGDKAFCAGGNIRKLYDGMIQHPPMPNQKFIVKDAETFFSCEYQLYQQMHQYNKPIILWANGIIMGGGMGLMAMSSHRVVTDTTRFAMPEITIGLYPDATGSWLLQRFPGQLGLFFGLTGANGNAQDALIANLAEYAIASNEYSQLIEALVNASWDTNNLKHTASQALAHIHHTEHLAKSHILSHWQQLHAIINKGDLQQVDEALTNPALQEQYKDDKWMQQALNNYQHGCPVTAALTFEIFKRAKGLSLEQVLSMELTLSLNCAKNPDFREGVRALLIDKDRTPNWSRTLNQCLDMTGRAYIEAHFQSPYDE